MGIWFFDHNWAIFRPILIKFCMEHQETIIYQLVNADFDYNAVLKISIFAPPGVQKWQFLGFLTLRLFFLTEESLKCHELCKPMIIFAHCCCHLKNIGILPCYRLNNRAGMPNIWYAYNTILPIIWPFWSMLE